MSRHPSRHRPGAHELGQNHLRDRRVIDRIVHLASQGGGPLVDWGAGEGALTLPLAQLGRPVEAIEIDPRAAGRLRARAPRGVRVRCADILRHAPPPGAVVVASLPYHLTTPALRHLLASSTWRRAVLVVQWEVARKRAAVGGATMLTAQWAPWYTAALDRRIPAAAFRPRPTVDSGLLVLDRREEPLLEHRDRRAYQQFVRAVFTGSGRGLEQILRRAGLPARAARAFCARHGRSGGALPRDVDPSAWSEAFLLRGR